MSEWYAAKIIRALHLQTFRGSVICVPNCYYTGYECDLLVVRESLKLVDVEVKISRSDLKSDIHKDKWWNHSQSWAYGDNKRPDPVRREWPPRIWKHYYAMPKEIWKPELEAAIPSASGILLMNRSVDRYEREFISVEHYRRAKTNPAAQPIDVAGMRKIAYLSNVRMIEADKRLCEIADENRRLHSQLRCETIAAN